MSKLYNRLRTKLINWLIYEPPPTEMPASDFNRLKYELHPGDIILIEGRSQMSRLIRTITQSPWTHAALYIGRLIDIEDDELQATILKHVDVKEKTRLVIEGMMDKGAVIAHLNTYHEHHIRICRPIGITREDSQEVIRYAVKSLGQPYNMRQLLDLARFVLPWSLFPRRWGSSLFRTSSGKGDSGICSTLIAEAFTSIQFPILPYLPSNQQNTIEIYERNPHLFTPKDFDFSPFFEIIKYPLFNPEEPLPYYRRLPWSKTGLIHQDQGVLSDFKKKKKKKSFFKKNNQSQEIPVDEIKETNKENPVEEDKKEENHEK